MIRSRMMSCPHLDISLKGSIIARNILVRLLEMAVQEWFFRLMTRNAKGIAQNEAEFDWYAQNYGILPNIYESADDKSWILVEYVLPAKAKDIQVCLGVDFNTFQRFVYTAYCYYSGEMDCYNQLSDEEFSEMCENNEWFESLYNYMADYQLPCGDLQRLANLGMVLRDGQPQIVILDSGLTQQIYDEYYKR